MMADQLEAEKDTKPKAEFLFLAEELQSYILSFLPWRDILRCTSVCKTLRQTYVSSSHLQYIVELGGQHLLPVPIADLGNHTSIYKRLQLLRDKAYAWFKFDLHSFQTVSMPEQCYIMGTSIADGHLCVWNEDEDSRHSARIFPILPKTLTENNRASLVSRIHCKTCSPSRMPSIMILSGRGDSTLTLGTLDGDAIHPQAAGQTLFLSVLTAQGNRSATENLKLKCCGRHIALLCSPLAYDGGNTFGTIWWLQLWNWQHSTTSNSNLRDTMLSGFNCPIDFCFVGNDRLLIVSDYLKLYSIEDMSREPQLLASYLMPVPVSGIQCYLDGNAHSSQQEMQARQTMWMSDPENRLLSLVTHDPRLILVVSTRIFDLSCFDGTPVIIPWKDWGPPNARVFPDPWRVFVSGNRVVQVVPVFGEMGAREYRLYMMDFSPLAVERHQGLGRVVKEPTTTKISELDQRSTTVYTLCRGRVRPPGSRTSGRRADYDENP
ncbi:hypothetical protein DFH29DRAFT_1067803 [Suillus ampliporus]|nr:hypothetical protein DFH29DRAFT_1067803 [Suillus ampliporus]